MERLILALILANGIAAAGCEGSQHTKDLVAKKQAAKARDRAQMGPMGSCLNYIDKAQYKDDLSCVCVGSECDLIHSDFWTSKVTVTKLRCTSEGCLAR